MKANSLFSYIAHRIKKSRVLSGALLLTAAGMISRVIGFFYRIFLSRTFGAENIGIYQLISPVMALAYSLSVAGFQTAISRMTATVCACDSRPQAGQNQKGEKTPAPGAGSFAVPAAGMLLSLFLSLAIAAFVYLSSEEIAVRFLLEARCAPLLKILSLSFPVSAIHSCVNGYFYGQKKAAFPAFSQLFEQIVRVGSVMFLCSACLADEPSKTPDISLAVTGMVIGEIASAILSLLYLWLCFQKTARGSCRETDRLMVPSKSSSIASLLPKLLILAVPLSAGRVIQNLLQSIEAIAIPDRLRMFGLDNAAALSEYGILTGMSLPFILFPTALTGSIAVMLLPAVSEAQALRQERTIAKAVQRSVRYCLLLGFFCLGFFLLFGPVLGKVVFHQERAGSYLQILGFMCPFLYMNSTLSSILHGLGKTVRSFFYSVASLLLRLAFVFFCIPVFGIKGYLWALLASQLLLSGLQLIPLRKYLRCPGA